MLNRYKLNCVGQGFETRQLKADAAKSEIIYVGDAVAMETDGYVIKLRGHATALLASAGYGVVAAIKDTNSAASREDVLPTNLPAAHAGDLSVIIDPEATFALEFKNSGSVTQAYVGASFNLATTGNQQIDNDTISATDDRQFTCIGIFTDALSSLVYGVLRWKKHAFKRTASI
jgi:hypothetical protein